MSPEQARGEEVGQQADIWSFGVVLYEMLTGKLPFGGDYEQAVIYSILNEEQATLPERVPVAFRQLVFKCLEKEAEDRHQSAELLLADLQKLKKEIDSVSSPSKLSTAVKSEKSIIVLPFDDLSPNKDNAYFSDGLTEEIITDLSQVNSLRVISRNSAMTLKGTKKSLRQIGYELNVRYALMGGVRKADNNLRITVQLLDCQTDAHMWAKKYKGTLENIFEIQESVSQSIVNALQLKLTIQEKQKIAEKQIENPRAYELYLKARDEMHRATEESLIRAYRFLEDGLEIVGENVLIYSALGHIHFQFYNYGIRSEVKELKKAEEYAQKILDLDPNSSRALTLYGCVRFKEGNLQEVAKLLNSALALDPNDRDALMWIVYTYADSGKIEVANCHLDKLLEIDPLLPLNHWAHGWTRTMEGKFQQALQAFCTMYEMDLISPLYRIFYGYGLALNSQLSDAFNIFDRIVYDTPDTIFSWLASFFKFALMNEKAKAIKAATESMLNFARTDELFSLWLADCYALINDKESAMKWLEHSVSRGFINYPFLVNYDPFLGNVRNEPRFKQLMIKVKHEWESFEV